MTRIITKLVTERGNTINRCSHNEAKIIMSNYGNDINVTLKRYTKELDLLTIQISDKNSNDITTITKIVKTNG